MSKTFTLESNPYNGRKLRLYCTQSTDIATNKSTITWTLYSEGGTAYYYTTGPTTVKINGTQVYYIERKGYTSEVFPAKKGSVSGTIDVPHDNNGEKTITVELSTAIYVSQISTYSGKWTLDSIPRKATLTIVPESFTNEDKPTINYSNPAGNVPTKLEACISLTGSKDDVQYREISRAGTSYQFPLTEEEISTLCNATNNSRTVYFFVRTTLGGAIYLHDKPSTFIVKESDKTKPTVTLNVTLNNGNLPSAFNDLYIQNKSRVDVTLTAQGKYNASINRLYTEINGQTNNYTEPFLSNVIQSQGAVDIVGYATDSRGFTNANTKTINVIAYSKPLVIPLNSENAILCYRSDGNGKRVGSSTSVWVKAQRSYHTVTSGGEQKNFCALQYRYKESSVDWNDSIHEWQDLISKTNTATNQYDALIPGAVFDKKTSYTIQIRAFDDIGEYDLKTFDIPTEDVALHLGRGGKNVTVGSYCDYSEEYTFHSKWKAIFDEGMHGTVLNQEVNDILDFALTCRDGFTPIHTSKETANLPNESGYDNSSGYVQKSSNSRINVYLTNYYNGDIAVNVYLDGVWNGWKFLRLQ